jgi:hypothetical protein
LHEQRERGEEGDRSDVWSVLGNRERFFVLGQSNGEGIIVALTEEIGFADRFLRQRGVEGKERLADQQGGA